MSSYIRKTLPIAGVVLILATACTVMWALHETPEPETRTFERPIDGTTYERTQRVWRVEE